MSKHIELLKEKDEVYRLAKRKLSESEITYRVRSELSEEELQSYIAKLAKEMAEKIEKFKQKQAPSIAKAEQKLGVAKQEYDVVKAERNKVIQEFMTRYGKISHEKMCELLSLETGDKCEMLRTITRRGSFGYENYVIIVRKSRHLVARKFFVGKQLITESKELKNLDWMIYYLYHKGFIAELNDIWQYDEKFAERICSAIESKHIAKIDEQESEAQQG